MSDSSQIDRRDIQMPPGNTGAWGELEFRRLLQKLPAAAYTCDPTGLITYYNQQAVDLWGRAPKLNHQEDRFCGSFKLFLPDGSSVHHEHCWMAKALEMNQGYNGQEIVVQRPDGRRLAVLAYANPIHDQISGNLIGAVNVLVDITDRKQAENALREADRIKDEFLATLAHELRNPLAPLQNAAHVLRLQPQTTPESGWALEVIERQTQQMTRLIGDLLDISRISCNKLNLSKQPMNLSDVLRTAVETSRPVIESGSHELIITECPEPIYLDADATRLAQAISNLLNNAAKFTDTGGRIHLTLRREGSDAIVSVRDSGIGIPEEMLGRVFEMFTQVDRSLNKSRGGLGIGLTLVKRLVQMHDGSITVRSDGPGKGSEFTIRLPILIGFAPQRASSKPPQQFTRAAFPLRILIADDNRDSAQSLATLLKMFGNEVRLAYDGIEAIDIANEYRPDVALMDIGMPGMNGYEAAKQIRQQPWGREMTLIAITGWGQTSDKQHSQKAGFNHHLVKPVEIDALQQILTSIQPEAARQ